MLTVLKLQSYYSNISLRSAAVERKIILMAI
uniref:Uncharacterized protein n=1 Tax=Arundo donax TaxID=35708 RepID=A0A0A8Z9V6_ARUDO